jgi:uncharacterized membrane protein YagU involved in acid resistance
MDRFLAGAVAGLAATAPMTAAMNALYGQLPAHERHPLPPWRITMRALKKMGVKHRLDESERHGLTLLAHYAYGTAAGSLYGAVAPRRPIESIAGGVGYGLVVWAGSYLGLLPALGLHPPATRDATRRNALMIGAHVVWGAALGAVANQLKSR